MIPVGAAARYLSLLLTLQSIITKPFTQTRRGPLSVTHRWFGGAQTAGLSGVATVALRCVCRIDG